MIGSQALHASVAGGPKDIEFCAALVNRGLVRADTMRDRLAKVKDRNHRTPLGCPRADAGGGRGAGRLGG